MALRIYEIPLIPGPQRFSVTMLGVEYSMALIYRADPGPGWVLDIADAAGNKLVSGRAVTPGSDLLRQYPYLRFGVELFFFSDGTDDPEEALSFESIGREAHMFYRFDDGRG